MSGDADDLPPPRVGAVRPPPSDAPESVEVPRMEPPPPSLEAMVRSTRSDPKTRARTTPWLWWLALLLFAAGITAYVAR